MLKVTRYLSLSPKYYEFPEDRNCVLFLFITPTSCTSSASCTESRHPESGWNEHRSEQDVNSIRASLHLSYSSQNPQCITQSRSSINICYSCCSFCLKWASSFIALCPNHTHSSRNDSSSLFPTVPHWPWWSKWKWTNHPIINNCKNEQNI